MSFDDFLMGLAELPGDSLMLPKPEGCNDEDLANCKAKKYINNLKDWAMISVTYRRFGLVLIAMRN